MGHSYRMTGFMEHHIVYLKIKLSLVIGVQVDCSPSRLCVVVVANVVRGCRVVNLVAGKGVGVPAASE